MAATFEREERSSPPAPVQGWWWRQVVESLPQLIWSATPDGRGEYLSPPWADYTGVPLTDLCGLPWQALVHPADRDGLHQTWSVATAARSPFGAELRVRRHDGTYRWFDVRATPLCDTSGRIERWFGSNTDIEDRRVADSARQESETRLETVLDTMSEGVVMGDLNGEIRSWNRAALVMHGCSSAVEGQRAVAEFEHLFELRTLEGAVLPAEAWPMDRILHGEAVRDVTVRLRHKDWPSDRILSYTGTELPQPDGRSLPVVTISDLTDQYEAIQARLESEEQLRLANEAAGIGTYDIDFAVGHIRYSPEMCALLGVDGSTEHPLDESLGFVHPDDAEDFDRLFATARDPSGTGTAHGEHRFVHSSGEVRWAAWSARTSFGSTPDGRRPVRTVGAYVDVTEPRRAERRLATQNAVSRSLVDVVVTGEAVSEIIRSLCESEGWDLGAYWQVDSSSGQLRCADLWHRDDVLFAPFIDATRALTFAPGEGLPGRVWSTAAPIMIEDVGRDPTYERAAVALEAGLRSAVAFPIVVRGEVSGVLDFVGRGVVGREGEPLEMLAAIGRTLGSYFDRKRTEVERQELEGELRQSQRMEAIGALSGGIAHDFNNILGAIVGNVELALEDVGEGHPALQSLNAIGQASQHARELVQQILTFAQQGRVERRVVSLAPVAAESVGMLRATLPAGVELTLHCDPDCPLVLADVTQIQQVIVNLGTNAWHTLQDRAGTIEISLAAVTVDESQARRLPGLRPGHCALLTVSDTGNGIDAAMLERIFDPFFTTKAHGIGNGTGLGLSVVHGIVQRHEGAILVSSVLGSGSSFEIYLPAVEGKATETHDWAPRSSLHGHGEHILFVDDQEALVTLADRMLPRLGYQVTSFTDASLALEAFAADPEGYAVVVTDMNMPHLSGLDVTAQVHKLRPDVPVVLLSGYVEPDLLEQARRQGLGEVVSKPLDRRALGEALHRALHPPAVEVR